MLQSWCRTAVYLCYSPEVLVSSDSNLKNPFTVFRNKFEVGCKEPRLGEVYIGLLWLGITQGWNPLPKCQYFYTVYIQLVLQERQI